MKIGEVITLFEQSFPLCYQEAYDNSGLQVGSLECELTGVMLSVETTEEVLEECLTRGCNLLISHHPLLFKPLYRITENTYQERCVAYALKHGITVYAAHTNADNMQRGINRFLADKLDLPQWGRAPLIPMSDTLYKLQVFVPISHQDILRQAIHSTGAGTLGNYTECSFSYKGEGRFTPNEQAQPYTGVKGEQELVEEVCVSMLLERHQLKSVVRAIKKVHPYEEPAFDIVEVQSSSNHIGGGMLVSLPEEVCTDVLLKKIKECFKLPHLAYSNLATSKVKTIALCGGSGGSMLKATIAAGADFFLTGEAKYNDFLDAQGKITLVTMGHHESEQIAVDLFEEFLCEKFPQIIRFRSQKDLNPVKYL